MKPREENPAWRSSCRATRGISNYRFKNMFYQHTLIFKKRFAWVAAAGIWFSLSTASAVAYGQNGRPHKPTGAAPEEWKTEIKAVKINRPEKNLKRINQIRNRGYLAFSVYQETKARYRIFFIERKTKKLYEIRGAGQPNRPFTDLRWKNEHNLVFDSWSNPHHGAHYEFDARARKIVRILIFED